MSGLFDEVLNAIAEKRNQLDAWANEDKPYLDRPMYGPGLMDVEYYGEPGATFYYMHGKNNGVDFDVEDIDRWRRDDRGKAKAMHMQMVDERYGNKPYTAQQNIDMWQEIVDRLMDPNSGYVNDPNETIGRWPLGSKHRPLPQWMKKNRQDVGLSQEERERLKADLLRYKRDK